MSPGRAIVAAGASNPSAPALELESARDFADGCATNCVAQSPQTTTNDEACDVAVGAEDLRAGKSTCVAAVPAKVTGEARDASASEDETTMAMRLDDDAAMTIAGTCMPARAPTADAEVAARGSRCVTAVREADLGLRGTGRRGSSSGLGLTSLVVFQDRFSPIIFFSIHLHQVSPNHFVSTQLNFILPISSPGSPDGRPTYTCLPTDTESDPDSFHCAGSSLALRHLLASRAAGIEDGWLPYLEFYGEGSAWEGCGEGDGLGDGEGHGEGDGYGDGEGGGERDRGGGKEGGRGGGDIREGACISAPTPSDGLAPSSRLPPALSPDSNPDLHRVRALLQDLLHVHAALSNARTRGTRVPHKEGERERQTAMGKVDGQEEEVEEGGEGEEEGEVGEEEGRRGNEAFGGGITNEEATNEDGRPGYAYGASPYRENSGPSCISHAAPFTASQPFPRPLTQFPTTFPHSPSLSAPLPSQPMLSRPKPFVFPPTTPTAAPAAALTHSSSSTRLSSVALPSPPPYSANNLRPTSAFPAPSFPPPTFLSSSYPPSSFHPPSFHSSSLPPSPFPSTLSPSAFSSSPFSPSPFSSSPFSLSPFSSSPFSLSPSPPPLSPPLKPLLSPLPPLVSAPPSIPIPACLVPSAGQAKKGELQRGKKAETGAINEEMGGAAGVGSGAAGVGSGGGSEAVGGTAAIDGVLRRSLRSSSERLNEMQLDELSQYFRMSIQNAARVLGVGLTVLKKRCRELGIQRWPHRKLKSLDNLIENMKEIHGPMAAETVEQLEAKKELLGKDPKQGLDPRIKTLRQVCFKASYKRRKAHTGSSLKALQGEMLAGEQDFLGCTAACLH
ncbi:unnamed protein product [Closterium sp. Yama58-4]|nr:unnamed protein product [Closterium sp. Yama58-4]